MSFKVHEEMILIEPMQVSLYKTYHRSVFSAIIFKRNLYIFFNHFLSVLSNASFLHIVKSLHANNI